MLDNIRVASPCHASWEAMEGDKRKRFCSECNKHVYNISAMSRRDAEQLLASGQSICGRFYRRADGTILTEDCPVGLRAKVARVAGRLSFAISGALSFATAFGQTPLNPVISGTVTDPAGASILGATVILVDDNGRSVTVRSNDDGIYRFETARGVYTVKAEMPGFKPLQKRDVRVGGPTKLDLKLDIGATDMGGLIAEALPAK